jgi:hypothetical protein
MMIKIMMKACWIPVVTVCLVATAAHSSEHNGIKAGPVKIMPYADLSTIYNSNVETQPNDEKDDTSFNLKLGAGFQNDADGMELIADLWGSFERYVDLSDEDHEDFGESISLGLMQGEKVTIDLMESYDNIQSLDYAVGSINARELIKAEAKVAAELTEKLTIATAYAYDLTDYESPREFDWDQHAVTVYGNQKLTDKTDGSVAVGAILQDSDGFDDSSEQYKVTAGVKTRGTDKVTGTARIGVLNMTADYDDETIPHFDIAGMWQTTDKVKISTQINNAIEPGTLVVNDYNKVIRGNVSANWQLLQEVGLTFTAGYARNDYYREVDVDGVLTAKDDDTFSGAVRATYTTPTPMLTAFLEVKVDDKQSSIPANEYQQTIVTLGANFVY